MSGTHKPRKADTNARCLLACHNLNKYFVFASCFCTNVAIASYGVRDMHVRVSIRRISDWYITTAAAPHRWRPLWKRGKRSMVYYTIQMLCARLCSRRMCYSKAQTYGKPHRKEQHRAARRKHVTGFQFHSTYA